MGYLSDLGGLVLPRLVARWNREDSVYIMGVNLVVVRVKIANTLAEKVGYLIRDIIFFNKQASLYIFRQFPLPSPRQYFFLFSFFADSKGVITL